MARASFKREMRAWRNRSQRDRLNRPFTHEGQQQAVVSHRLRAVSVSMQDRGLTITSRRDTELGINLGRVGG